MSTGKFITLEGIEGVGKSTHAEFIKELLEKAGYTILFTREPGGTELGESVREILLHGKELNIHSRTELLLMFSARAQHLTEVIRPALLRGEIVLCDRFTDATYAYQGGGRGIARNEIMQLENYVQQGLKPDITLLLDAPVEVGLMRANKRGESDRFEAETVDFFENVRQCYLTMAQDEPKRIHIVDANQELEKVRVDLTILLNELGLC